MKREQGGGGGRGKRIFIEKPKAAMASVASASANVAAPKCPGAYVCVSVCVCV